MPKILTADGSFTLFSDRFNEHYHSVHGAESESKVVYIQALERYVAQTAKNEITIFEMGFGSGLNAWLAYEFAVNNQIKLTYISLEKYPVPAEVLMQNKPAENYRLIIEADWNLQIELHPNFKLKKIETDITNFDFETIKPIDLIFHDAFSPDTQPELWTSELFTAIYNATEVGGVLATYSSKGMVKEALRTAGFFVKRLPGPQGKRHILNATKQ